MIEKPKFFTSVVSASLLSLVFATSTTAAEKRLPIEGQVFEIEGQTAFLISPDKTDADKPTPWVWYAPTLPGLPGKFEVWMFERFLDQGVAIAGIDVGESYGSPKGRAIYSALYEELVENRGMAKQACQSTITTATTTRLCRSTRTRAP